MIRKLVIAALVALVGLFAVVMRSPSAGPVASARFAPPAGAIVTHFPARGTERQQLTILAATDVTFMHPFITQYQELNPGVAVHYSDMLSTDLLSIALESCRRQTNVPDVYLSIATDHLVRLANDGCGHEATFSLTVPSWREWRHEVFAFAIEPAVLVYNRMMFRDRAVPQTHLELIGALRSDAGFWNGKIGTYDINKSGVGFNYAEFDSRESSIFGRLIESLGRSNVQLYCCSNEMVRAVEQGRIALAYDVQLSYAYAAQRHDPNVGIVIPSDFQAVQTRSAMIASNAPHRELARGFIDFLLSDRAQQIDASLFVPAAGSADTRFVPSDRLRNQANVSSALLRLQDQARRRAFTDEWRQAVHPAGSSGAGSRRPSGF